MYETIADYYRKGLFDEDDISSFVPIGWITEDQKNDCNISCGCLHDSFILNLLWAPYKNIKFRFI